MKVQVGQARRVGQVGRVGQVTSVAGRRVSRAGFLVVFGLMSVVRLAGAQTRDQPIRLTLDEAIARGLETSQRIAEATARGDAADAVAGQRRAAQLPQIAAQAGYTRTNHVDTFGVLLPNNQLRVIYPDIPDNYRSRLDVQWPVYTGGRLDALERAARIEATASGDEVAAARRDVALEISRAYWTLVSATASVSVVEEAVRRADAHLQDVRNQFAAGLVAPNDVLSIEAMMPQTSRHSRRER